MHTVQQIVPISEMKIHHNKVMNMLKAGVVILAQRSKPAAVLVSVAQWDTLSNTVNELQNQLARERRLRLSNQRHSERQADATKGVLISEIDPIGARL